MPIADDELRITLLKLRLVIGGLIIGLIATGLALSLITEPSSHPHGNPGLFVAVVAALVFAETTTWVYLRRAFVQRQRQAREARPEVDPEALLIGPFIVLRTIAAAMIEFPGLFGIVIYLLTGLSAALALPAVAVFVLLRLQADPEDFRRFVREVG